MFTDKPAEDMATLFKADPIRADGQLGRERERKTVGKFRTVVAVASFQKAGLSWATELSSKNPFCCSI